MGRHSAPFIVTDRARHRREMSQGKKCTTGCGVCVVAVSCLMVAAFVAPDQEPILRLPRAASPAPTVDVPANLPVIAEVVGPSTVRPTLRLTELRVAAVAAVRPLVTPDATPTATPEPARRDSGGTAAAQPKRDKPRTAAEPAKPVQPKPRLWPRPKPQPDPGGEQNPGGEEQGGETGSGGEESNSGGGEPTSGGENSNGGEHIERKHPVRDLVKHVVTKVKDSKSKSSSKGDSDE